MSPVIQDVTVRSQLFRETSIGLDWARWSEDFAETAIYVAEQMSGDQRGRDYFYHFQYQTDSILSYR